jgi:voltage-gated potassium channel
MSWKSKLYSIVHSTDTRQGKVFHVVLFILIVISVLYVLLESIDRIDQQYHSLLVVIEWIITIFFTIEYVLKIISLEKPRKYIFSFFGIVDLLSTIPLYLAYFFTGGTALLALRALRLLRVFRILKLVRYIGEVNTLARALVASRLKIAVFIYIVLILCVIMGAAMYMVEGNANSGFTSIPKSIYWTIVTITTVGYGDIAPATNLGQFIASFIMMLGYGIIAIPTGIVTSEMAKSSQKIKAYRCKSCGVADHGEKASYCHQCGSVLED